MGGDGFVSKNYYDITQHWSQAKSLSLVLVLRFISRTISAKTSLTFILDLALLSMNEQFQICARAYNRKKQSIFLVIKCTGSFIFIPQTSSTLIVDGYLIKIMQLLTKGSFDYLGNKRARSVK